ncbi:MAG: MarR family winged helix-turn-helix transcriptional regulator [Bacteroidota bacterium]|jgi:DNA-binding MarR family transcriptional regulator
MLSKPVRTKLLKKRPPKEESVGRLIYLLYRHLTAWGESRWPKVGLHAFGPSHIHLLATIGLEGVSNSGMARRAKVSKQAMSKLVKDMLALGLIVIQVNENDSRCNIISLTDKGGETLMQIWETNDLLKKQVEKRLGKAKSKRILTLMDELVDALDAEEEQSGQGG